MSYLTPRKLTALVSAFLITSYLLLASQTTAPRSKDQEKDEEEVMVLSPFMVSSSLGATPGGSKDINYFRSGVSEGRIPHPDSLTPEGLFSGYDLPLDLGGSSEGLFRVQAAATTAAFEVLPDVQYLGQLALGSNMRSATWKRAPLNLVAVIDKSGSMDGEPLATVRVSLHRALSYLHEGDQIGIVLYGDRSHVHLEPTPVTAATRSRIDQAIDEIRSAGSTNMEAGLQLGFDVARESAGQFSGTTRVMLFTDERPNVGDTSAAGFMALAEAAADDHIGLTTIGVGEIFDTTLAARISSVRGGNLYFFQSCPDMEKAFAADFDTMVSELAREFSVRIEPAHGLRLAGVFGIPGELLHWDGNALELKVETIFLSKRKGAIYFAFAPDSAGSYLPPHGFQPGASLARISYRYRDVANDRVHDGKSPCVLLASGHQQVGLIRGCALVDEYLTLKKLSRLHVLDNDQNAAFHLANSLLQRIEHNQDQALAPEKALVRDMYNTLAVLSGHTSEVRVGADAQTAAPLVGAWRSPRKGKPRRSDDFLVIWPHGAIEVSSKASEKLFGGKTSVALRGEPPRGTQGEIWLAEDDPEATPVRFSIDGDRLKLMAEADRDGTSTMTFKRCDYADIPSADTPRPSDQPATVDPLSGLPVDHIER